MDQEIKSAGINRLVSVCGLLALVGVWIVVFIQVARVLVH